MKSRLNIKFNGCVCPETDKLDPDTVDLRVQLSGSTSVEAFSMLKPHDSM
jgi:hypothetical protein